MTGIIGCAIGTALAVIGILLWAWGYKSGHEDGQVKGWNDAYDTNRHNCQRWIFREKK
jgi:hypothetical protein